MAPSHFIEIEKIVNEFSCAEIINEISLPANLLDPRTEEEIDDRFSFFYHKLVGSIFITSTEVLGRKLSKTEIGFISERLQARLKEKGF
jgi:hypothetical protein